METKEISLVACAVFQLVGIGRGERAGREAAGLVGSVNQAIGGDGLKFAQVAEAREGKIVPQHAVTAARHQKRHDDVRVVLPQIEVLALDVNDADLPLAEAVKRFVGVRFPLLAHVERLFALHFGGRDRPAIGLFGQNGFAVGIEK